MSTCHVVAGRSLIDLAASRLALRAPALRAGLGSATAWPVVARAQQGERVRHIGVLMTQAESDRQQQSFLAWISTAYN